MSFTVREAAFPTDADAVQKVWSWVYSLAAPKEPLEPPAEREKWYVGLEDGTPTTACKVHGYTVARGEADLSCGGVAAVATLSEHRKKGHGQRFMVDVLNLMREHGHVLSSLYAFRDPFYARSGYGTCGWRWKIVCPAHRMPKTECAMPVRQLVTTEVECLTDVHTQFVRGLSGSPLRTPAVWKRRMGTKPPLVYAIGDPIEAYLWVRITEFWGNVDVGEIAWSTPRGYEAVMSVLRGIGHNQNTFTWMEPPQSRFFAAHFDQGVEMSVYRQTMHRVLDVEKALKQLKPKGEGAFTFSVRDEQIADNDGAWSVSWTDQGVDVQRSPRGDIAFSIGAFSQAFMGAPSVAELARHGLIEVRDPLSLSMAERLFTPMPVCCMEFF
jgi:predicted acetyltransferase